MSEYELMVIIKPQAEADEVGEAQKDIEVLISQHKGQILATDDWGEKQLSYKIRGHDRGNYIVYGIEMEPASTSKFSAKLQLHKSLLRYLLVKQPKKKETSKN
jgi:ribosomal protein S6